MSDLGEYPDDAWELLSPILTEERRQKIQTVAARRTYHIQVVLQDIHDPHNVSACLRSAEAFGVQCAHIVTIKERFSPSMAAKGVDRWLDIHRYHDIAAAVRTLKGQGLLLAAGFPDANATPLDQLPCDRPLAIIFGNEHDGVHKDWHPHIDIPFTIPMVGFVESLNISVSCAVSLQKLTHSARQTVSPERYYPSSAEHRKLLNKWVCRQYPETYMQQLVRLRDLNK